ncbi:hypothetical protein P3W45_000275 [Vairimorpha bombi]|jgi:chromatin assembly factor 1 subunit B
MTKRASEELFPIEVTTHNLYFHEEASIFSIDSFSGLIATCGGDNIVRLWNIKHSTDNIKNDSEFRYTTALNSSIKIEYVSDIKGHNKSVNCVRFNETGWLASASDGGKIIVSFSDKSGVIRDPDGLDCYEVVWNKSILYVGLSNGHVEIYDISFIDDFEFKLIRSFNPHTDIIQGMAYNPKYNLILTISKDKSSKLFLCNENMELLEKYTNFNNEKLFSVGRSFFKRICFSKNGDLAFLCNVKQNSVLVYHSPFRSPHWIYKLGPFNSEPVKILENGKFLFILTKKSLYIYQDSDLLICVDNMCFKSATDATVTDNIIFISSLDGFVSSLKWK